MWMNTENAEVRMMYSCFHLLILPFWVLAACQTTPIPPPLSPFRHHFGRKFGRLAARRLSCIMT